MAIKTKKYVQTPREFEAVQFTGKDSRDFAQWVRERETDDAYQVIAGGGWVKLTRHSYSVVARKGEWFVYNPVSGGVSVWSDADFKEHFVPAKVSKK